MQNYYQFMVPRLNGHEIKNRFRHCLSLVSKGIAGFIIFGGDLEIVRKYVGRLQKESELPLIISADLERGLGQQLTGGTDFPPAMAISSAHRNGKKMADIRRSFKAVAEEAAYAGINAIYAPVLDINTNPKNPIIAVRAFGDDMCTVGRLGIEMIRQLERLGIAACGKHFPGHGDTEVDSHIKLPVLNHDIKRLNRCELRPFRTAMDIGVSMIMLGHLSVPAIDPSGTPVSISKQAVELIRTEMRYDGILVTDALNMSGIGRYSEEEASMMALKAGVDILLHPSEPERVSAFLKKKKVSADPSRLIRFRKRLIPEPVADVPNFGRNRQLSMELTSAAIMFQGKIKKGKPVLIILVDETDLDCSVFKKSMQGKFPEMKIFVLRPQDRAPSVKVGYDETLIVAIFSETKAWKGGASSWLTRKILHYEKKAALFISFGSPYLLDMVKVNKMYVYWSNEQAQKAAAEELKNRL